MPSLVNEFGNVLPELPAAKQKHASSKFKSGSYLDDDSLEVANKIKALEPKQEKKSPGSKPIKHKPPKIKEGKLKSRQISTIEKMYNSLKTANQEPKGSFEGSYDGPQVSINVGGRTINLQDSMDMQDQEQSAAQTFDIATGNINHGNRSINYTVQEILGTCFAINLVVSVTQQSWMVFVPSSETVLELLRIWKLHSNPENMNKLCTWLLSCITLEFDDMTIVAAHFNHSLFQKCYTQEMIVCVQAAAIKVQAHIRRYLSNKRLRFQLLKSKQIQESRILAGMRVKAIRRKAEEKAGRAPKAMKPIDPLSTISSHNTEQLLVDITQALHGGQTPQSEGPAGGKKKKRKGSPKKKRGGAGEEKAAEGPARTMEGRTPRSPSTSQRGSVSANARRRKVAGGGKEDEDIHRTSLIEKEVNNLKSDIGGTLNEFQSELQILKSELVAQKQSSMLYSRPNSSQFAMGVGGSPAASRGGSGGIGRIKAASFSGGGLVDLGGGSLQDVDAMKKEINALLSKIDSLEENLTAQRISNERTQEIAKLEIMSAKLEAESAVERAAAKVRSDTINEIASQMRDIEKERSRLEEEKLQRDLIREETMRKDMEKKQQQMSEVLKQELFRQQLLQQQEQAGLLQRQQELQEKLLLQQQQQKVKEAPAGQQAAPTKPSPKVAQALPAVEQQPSARVVQQASNRSFAQDPQSVPPQQLQHQHQPAAVHVRQDSNSTTEQKQAVTSLPESVRLGGSSSSLAAGETKSKKSWNWLLFGGSKKQQTAPAAPAQPQYPFEAPLHAATMVISSEKTANASVLEPVAPVTAAPSEKKKSKRELKEERRYFAAVTIQHAALRFIRRRRFKNNENFVKLRAENLINIIDQTKEEKTINEAMSVSVRLNHLILANKTLNRLYTLVVKYDKNEVLYPANYDLLVEFLKVFMEDPALLKKGFDVLNIVLKLNPDCFEATSGALTALLMSAIASYDSDPLVCFKVTRCIYRLSEKSAAFRVSFGSTLQNMVVIRKLFEVYLKNPSIIENIMKCIINLCIDCVPNQDVFNQIGICDCVFFAFMEHLKVERLFYLICRAMVNLCANNHYTNQTQLAKGIYPNIFIKAIMLYKSNPRAIEQVITCVLSIVANHKVNKGKFQDAGLCEVLLDLIRISDNYPSILTNCFWALSNLSSGSNPARKLIHAKIIDTIKKFEAESPDPELVRHAKIALNRIYRASSNNASRVATPIASVNVVGGSNYNIGTAQFSANPDEEQPSSRPPLASSNRGNRLEGGGFNESVISDLSV